MSSEKNAFVATLQLLGKTQKKSNFIFIFGQMIEDQVLFHLPNFGGKYFFSKFWHMKEDLVLYHLAEYTLW